MFFPTLLSLIALSAAAARDAHPPPTYSYPSVSPSFPIYGTASTLPSAPAYSVPVPSTPAHSAPAPSTSAHSTPAHSAPAYSAPTPSTSAHSAPVYSAPTPSTSAHSTPAHSAPAYSAPTPSTSAHSAPAYSAPTPSAPTPSPSSTKTPTPTCPVAPTPSGDYIWKISNFYARKLDGKTVSSIDFNISATNNGTLDFQCGASADPIKDATFYKCGENSFIEFAWQDATGGLVLRQGVSDR
jgi:hypothetical protein